MHNACYCYNIAFTFKFLELIIIYVSIGLYLLLQLVWLANSYKMKYAFTTHSRNWASCHLFKKVHKNICICIPKTTGMNRWTLAFPYSEKLKFQQINVQSLKYMEKQLQIIKWKMLNCKCYRLCLSNYKRIWKNKAVKIVKKICISSGNSSADKVLT